MPDEYGLKNDTVCCAWCAQLYEVLALTYADVTTAAVASSSPLVVSSAIRHAKATNALFGAYVAAQV